MSKTITVTLVLGAVLLSLAKLDYGGLYTTTTTIPVVEGLNVAQISPHPRSTITTTRHQTTIQAAHQPIVIQSSPLYIAQKSKRRSATRLASTIDSGGFSDDSADNTNQEATIDEATTTIAQKNRRDTLVDDFLYGANYVHSQYLSILWKYSIVKTFTITVPIAIALWLNYDVYNTLFGILRPIFGLSSMGARLLQLPLELAQSFLLSGWNVSPEALAAAITFLPNVVAIPLVQLLLGVRTGVMFLIELCSGSNAIRFLSSLAAILIWRPAVEEWQYRSVLDKLLFGVPRWMLARGRDFSPSTAAALRQMKAKFKLSKNKDEESESEVAENSTTSTEADEDDLAPFLPDESTRILLGSILFATTRLGWLSADPADTVALSNSPYGFTIGFLRSIGSLFASSGGAVNPNVRILILLLAIHQTISTFFVAQHVFAGIYKRRGLVASVGAHVSWTVGKGTIPFRLAWKFGQGTFANLASASYGEAAEESEGENSDSTSLEDDESDDPTVA